MEPQLAKILSDKQLTTTALKLLLLLGSYKPGHCFPSYRYMAAAIGCSESTIYMNLKRLHTKGYLSHSRERRRNGGNGSNHYQLTHCPTSTIAEVASAPVTPPTSANTEVAYLGSYRGSPTSEAIEVQCDRRATAGFTSGFLTKTGAESETSPEPEDVGDGKHVPPWYQKLDAIWQELFEGPLFPHADTERLIAREIRLLTKRVGANSAVDTLCRRLRRYGESFSTDDKRGRYGSVRHFVQCHGKYEDPELTEGGAKKDRYAEDRARAARQAAAPPEPRRVEPSRYDLNAAQGAAARKAYIAEMEAERTKKNRERMLEAKQRERDRARDREELAAAAEKIRAAGT